MQQLSRMVVTRFIVSLLLLLPATASLAQVQGSPPVISPIGSGSYNVSWGLYYLQESTDGVNWTIVSEFASAPTSMLFSKLPGTYYYRTYYAVGFPLFTSVISDPVQVTVTSGGSVVQEPDTVLVF